MDTDHTTTLSPSLPAELSALLAEHAVPEEEGALLSEIERHGYYVCLTGPVEPGSTEANPWRWTVALLRWDSAANTHIHSGLSYGETARIALAGAVSWIIGQRKDGE